MIIERIRAFLASDPRFNLTPDVTDDASLIEAGVIDSFGIVELVVFLEKTFSFKVEPADLTEDHFETLEKIEQFVSAKIPAA